jgi:hypothetical protein
MLSRGERTRFTPLCLEGWLCQAFEVERQQDWPAAPLTLMVDGGNPTADYWLRADPVHLRARREELLLADPELLQITAAESADLAATLNAHFAADQIAFHPLHPARWYVKLPEIPDLETRTLSETAGASIARLMPVGRDALRWHRIVNEIQMLLHDHPVNAAREARGALVINSVWIWGGGTMPLAPGRHFSRVFSTNALAAAVATRAGVDALPLPANAGSWQRANHDKADAHHLIVLEQLASAAQYGDADAWRERIAGLEKDWFAPLVAALGKNGLDRVVVATLDASAANRYECGPRVRWAAWRRPRPLAAHLETGGSR